MPRCDEREALGNLEQNSVLMNALSRWAKVGDDLLLL